MMIDFANIAAPYQDPMRFACESIALSFSNIGKWVKERVGMLESVEAASRMFPAVEFYDNTVAVWIDAAQHATLTDEAPPTSVADYMLRHARQYVTGVERFAAGIGRIGVAVEEELMIPSLLSTFADILEAVIDSMDRFTVPDRSLFEVPHTASDLFGEGALFFRAFYESHDEVMAFAKQVNQIVLSLKTDEVAAPGDEMDWPAVLQEAVSWMVGAVMLVPLGSKLLVDLFRDGILAFKTTLLTHFEAIEKQAFDLRRAVLDFFYKTMSELGESTFFLMTALQSIFVENLKFYVGFIAQYVWELMTNVSVFMKLLAEYFNDFFGIVETIRKYAQMILDFNVLPLLGGIFGIAASALGARLTIDDLISFHIGLGAKFVKAKLEEIIDIASALLLAAETFGVPGVSPADIAKMRLRVEAVRKIKDILLTTRPFIDETGLPTRPGSFPNIAETILGEESKNLAKVLKETKGKLLKSVDEMFTSGHEFLLSTSKTFAAEADRAASLGSPARYALIAERADKTSELVFGEQADQLRKKIGTRTDTLARSFAGFIAGGGMDVVGAAIPLYVREMSKFWMKKKLEEKDRPTSPHILSRHGLRRVRMPRVVFNAPGAALDSDLVLLVAGKFKGVIEESYVNALDREERLP